MSSRWRASSLRGRPVTKRFMLCLSVGAAVVLIAVMSVVSLALATTPGFTDVQPGDAYYEAITELASREIVLGKTIDHFYPGDPVWRQHFAKMIVKTMDHPVPADIVCPFVDVDLAPHPLDPLYPAKYVAVCALHGITVGKTVTPPTFDPTGNITRWHVMSMVVRAVDEKYPGLLFSPSAEFVPTWNPSLSPHPDHAANAARAEYNGLLIGINLASLDPSGNMTRGEIAQVLHNVLVKIAPSTTTTTTTTTTTSTTTTSTTTTSTSTTTTSSTTTTTIPYTGYENIGGIALSGPAICSPTNGRLDVFVRGPGDALWQKTYSSGSWGDWHSLGESLISDPAAVAWNSNRIDVVYRGQDYNIWHKWWNGSVWSKESLGNVFISSVGSPAIASWSDGRLDVFVRGDDNALWQKTYSGGAWSGWVSRGGVLTSDPAAVSWDYNRIDVFVRGPYNYLWHTCWNGSTWLGWDNLGGILSSAPGVASWGYGRLDVFVVGPGNVLWQRTYSGAAWAEWHALTGTMTFTYAPDAVSWGANRIDVVGRGASNYIYHKWWNGSTWLP